MGASETQALLGRMWAEIQKASQQRELERIKASPEKHRLTRLMSSGSNTGYRYRAAGQRMIGKTKMEKTRFCRAVNKNAAGVYLIWRQVDCYKRVKGRWEWHQAQRHDFQWAPTKAEARDIVTKKAERRKAELVQAA